MKEITEYKNGKADPEEVEVTEEDISGNDEQEVQVTEVDLSEVTAELRVIEYKIDQNGQILTFSIALVAGLLVGLVFSIWFIRVWK